MNPNQVERKKNREGRKSCALLWDESFLWGLMARRALTEAGLSFDLIRSDDIRAGILPRYAMLFVPGGWAQAKLRSLGEKGQAEIRSFVENGGSYLGICGGAGLATQSDIGLLSVSRKSFQERVPSFSGPVRLSLAPHAVWENIKSPVFSAWWPLQFRITSQNDLRILATYDEAQADAFSADIKVGERQTNGWSELEESYGIFLDPQRLKDEPAVIEGRFGQGKVLLSLVHFDTPGDQNGQAVLRNLWQYLSSDPDWPIQASRAVKKQFMADTCPECQKTIMDIKATVDTLITMGERNSLWYWRNSWFLQWRRGIRGMEYSTLAVMTGEIASYLRHNCLGGSNEGNIPAESSDLYQDLAAIKELVIPFVKKAKILLAREKSFLATAVLSPVHCSDEAISRLRQELHGSSIRHGGKFKELILAVDRLLYQLISSDQSLLR
ncbi:MAG: BPL-N domain-containing protein [Smithella sp.]